MRLFFFSLFFLSSLFVFGDDSIPNLSDQVTRQLRADGFEIASSVTPAKISSVSAEIGKEAEARFVQIVVPSIFSMIDQRPAFATCPSTLSHSDGFAVSTAYEGASITAFVSEYKTTFFIIPQTPIRQDSQTAQSAFHFWTSRLLKPLWLMEGTENNLEVLPKGDYFLVNRLFYESDGSRRFAPWTKAESQKMAIDQAGRWLILSIIDIAPWRCTSCPPSGGVGVRRYEGSWFTGPWKRKPRLFDFKKFGHGGPKSPKP